MGRRPKRHFSKDTQTAREGVERCPTALAAAAESLQRVRLCATPQTAAHQAPPPLGLSRQAHSLPEKCKPKPQCYQLTPVRTILIKNLQTTNAGEHVEKREPACTVGGNISWYSHYGEKCGGSLNS